MLPDDDELAAIVLLLALFGLSWLADNIWIVWLVGIGCAVAGGLWWRLWR